MKNHFPSAGFTLLEILVVMFLLSITLFAVLPNFVQLADEPLRREAMRVASLFRYENDQAVAKKESRQLLINLDQGSWSVVGTDDKNTESGHLRAGIRFTDVVLPGIGRTEEGIATFRFSPSGLTDPALLHLAREEIQFSVVVRPYAALVETHEGYVE